ncbi:MAG: PilZ domain-containing protein [Spirochaetes bacterium]|nr:PilZ domain-containing protein [Spirochaetota bacterium]
MFQFLKWEHYLKVQAAKGEARKYMRLPAAIPVLYSFSEFRKDTFDFYQSHTLNISSGGIAIDIIEAPLALQQKLLKLKQFLQLKIDIPGKRDLIEFTGKIQWFRKIDRLHYRIGVSFFKIINNDKIDILSYSLRQIRKKFFFKASLIILILGLFLTGLWGLGSYQTKEKVKKKLIISEAARHDLVNQIEQLIKKRDTIKTQVDKNQSLISEQNYMIKKLKDIVDKNQIHLKNSEFMLQEIYKEWNYDTRSELILFEQLYKKGKQALDEKKYDQAILLLNDLIKKYPDSLMGYRMLIRAYYRQGDIARAEKVFKKYVHILKKQVYTK